MAGLMIEEALSSLRQQAKMLDELRVSGPEFPGEHEGRPHAGGGQ